MSTRHWFGMSLLLAVLQAAGGLGAAAQPAPALPFEVDESFSIASLHRPFIQEASAVVRLDVRRFVVESENEALKHVRRVVTVLKPEGKKHARIVLPYDKFREIDRLEGRLRDVRGNVVRELGDDDQRDFSAISDYSLYEERRVHVAELYRSTYPYTVEFEYTIEYDGLISWPTWRAHERKLPVEHAAFEVIAPEEIPIRYVVEHGSWPPEEGQGEGRHWVQWSATHLENQEREPYGPPWSEQVTTIHTAPTAFEIEDASGRMDSWAAFGQWYYQLSQGRAQLPDATAREVRSVVAAHDDTLGVVKELYRFMQEKTRYVSVQLGIGGWQPFPASYVDERSYGDCKALTNYMQALLAAADIDAYPVLIRAGRDATPILPDFPSHQFNHVILAVPVRGDTLWLENTDQTMPFGHVGASIEDRYGLLVSPEGGTLVRTPRSAALDNMQKRRAHVRLTAKGNAQADVHTTFTGNQQDRVRRALAQKPHREREKWLRKQIEVPNFSIQTADFSDAGQRQRVIQLPIALKLPRYGSKTGRRIFFQPNLMQRWTHVPPAGDGERTQPVHFGDYPFVDVDSVVYALPDGYDVEAMPDAVEIETPFARYTARIDKQANGGIVYRRRMEVHQTMLPPRQYAAFRSFLRQVAEADRQHVVLVQRTE